MPSRPGLSTAKAEGELDRLVERFRDRRAERLLEVLRLARGLTPELSGEGAKAVFAVPGYRRDLVFKRIAGRWFAMG